MKKLKKILRRIINIVKAPFLNKYYILECLDAIGWLRRVKKSLPKPKPHTITKTDKFGVLAVVSQEHINYGDDIQTLAQVEALKRLGIDDFIKVDREQLRTYKGPPVNLLMGGWYINSYNAFPPPPRVNPICTSIHINQPYLISRYWSFWKANEPIGCRDLYTVEQFELRDIKAYFSKCLTLTFDRYTGRREGVYTVDFQSTSFMETLPPDLQVTREIAHSVARPRDQLSDDFIVDNYSLDTAAGYLELYKKAELIITTRLHVALPARAFGTPVIFIRGDYRTNRRFSGLEKELNGSDGTVPFGELDPHIDYGIVQETKDRFAEDLKSRFSRLKC